LNSAISTRTRARAYPCRPAMLARKLAARPQLNALQVRSARSPATRLPNHRARRQEMLCLVNQPLPPSVSLTSILSVVTTCWTSNPYTRSLPFRSGQDMTGSAISCREPASRRGNTPASPASFETAESWTRGSWRQPCRRWICLILTTGQRAGVARPSDLNVGSRPAD